MYIYRRDEVGRRFRDALAAAAKRGVRVRVLLDWVGRMGCPRRFFDPLVKAGAEVVYFNPPGFRRWLGLIPRDHRKVMVIDDRIGHNRRFWDRRRVEEWCAQATDAHRGATRRCASTARPHAFSPMRSTTCGCAPVRASRGSGGIIAMSCARRAARTSIHRCIRRCWWASSKECRCVCACRARCSCRRWLHRRRSGSRARTSCLRGARSRHWPARRATAWTYACSCPAATITRGCEP